MPLIGQRAEALPPPVEDHLIHLLPQGLHVGIGKGVVQRAHAVGVVARAADGAVELGLADLAGRALGTVAAVGPVAAIIAAWDAEATDQFHTAPGAFHTRLLDHVNGCGMEMGFTGSPLSLAMVFFAEYAYEGKNCDSGSGVLHDV